MTKRIGATAAILLWSALGATAVGAQQAAKPCITAPEAADLLLFMAPEVIKGAGAVCRSALPDTALARRTTGPFIERYVAEADAAWPLAKAAILKLGGKEAEGKLQGDGAKAMVKSMLGPKIAESFKPKDCAGIDRLLTTLEPLPPRAVAEMFVAIVQLSQKRGGDLPICSATSQ